MVSGLQVQVIDLGEELAEIDRELEELRRRRASVARRLEDALNWLKTADPIAYRVEHGHEPIRDWWTRKTETKG